jgi:hypothetical protein
MKTVYSLPKDDGFYNRYATLIPTLRKLGYLAQVVSALTEVGVLYAVIYSSLADFWPTAAVPIATTGAIIGTAFIEIGLRQLLPYSARAILHRRFAGLDRLMTVFILAAAVGLLITSGLLSFQGSKAIVETVAPSPHIQTTTTADSIHRAARADALTTFAQDSTEISGRYAAQISAQKTAFSAKILNAQRLTTAKDEGSRRRARAQAAELQAARADALAGLEAAKAQEVRAAADRKHATLQRTTAAHSRAQDEIHRDNITAKQRSEGKIKTYGSGLAWFTVVCLVVLILAVIMEEAYQKGSGIDEIAQPNQYDFSAPIWAAFAGAISDRWNYHARTLIKRISDGTPAPPAPPKPGTLYDLESWQPRRVRLAPDDADPIKAHPPAQDTPLRNGKLASLAAELTGREANATSAYINEAVKTDAHAEPTQPAQADPFLKDCGQCGKPFNARVSWQKFCCEGCKLDYHEAKTGRRFNAVEYHKAKRK